MTKLQRAFSKWPTFKNMFCAVLEEQGENLTGYRRLFKNIMAKMGEAMPEAEIKSILVAAIYAPDTSKEEKLQARAMLRLAETITTKEQRQQIYAGLFVEE